MIGLSLIELWVIHLLQLVIGSQIIKKNLSSIILNLYLYKFSIIISILERNNPSHSKITHIKQELPTDTKDRIFILLKSVINKRKLYDIDSNGIVIMDQTAFQLNMPTNKTIHKVGAKTINMRAQNQEKLRVSVLL